MELISAYADGELADIEKKRIEEHLEACENCSAILDIYRETAVAVTESCVSVPDALRGGVMKKILDENIAGAGTNAAGKGRILRVILTRYVPIAACLALVLLTVPRFLNLNRTSTKNMSVGESMSIVDKAPEAPQISSPAGSVYGYSPESEIATGGGDASATTDGGTNGAPAPVPSAAPAPAPGTASDDSVDTRGDEPAPEPAEVNTVAEEDADDAAPEPEETPSFVDESGNAAEWAEAPAEPSESYEEGPVDADAPPLVAPPQIGGIPELPSSLPEMDFDLGGLLAEYEKGASILFTSSIYAIIEINGGLPALLEMYGLDPIEDREMYFEIPRDAAEMMIGFMGGVDGVKITIVDEDGEFAVLIYTPAG